ncbi:uncharacterized protein METZ01_LOCUS371543, partial [marine metagenome]
FSQTFTYTNNLADCLSETNHGTAVTEAIFDIAPGASYYVSNADNGVEFRLAVEWMVSEGVNVINFSLALHPKGPGDGTSPFYYNVLNTVDYAVANGITWVSSAGNFANGEHWYGQWSDPDNDGWQNFSGSDETNCGYFLDGEAINAYLRWQGSWVGESNDFDLVLYKYSQGSYVVVSESIDAQFGQQGQYPYEQIYYPVASTGIYCLKILNFESSSTPAWFQTFVWGSEIPFEYYVSERSLAAPAESANAGSLTVGASSWNDVLTIESFSSKGPTIDGRVKPDVVGVDNVYSVATQSSFPGTS